MREETKRETIEQVTQDIKEGLSIQEACNRAGISRMTYNRHKTNHNIKESPEPSRATQKTKDENKTATELKDGIKTIKTATGIIEIFTTEYGNKGMRYTPVEGLDKYKTAAARNIMSWNYSATDRAWEALRSATI